MLLRSACLFTFAIASFSASAVTVRAVGPTPVAISGSGASELSDIAYSNGSWYAVGDQGNSLYTLNVAIDPSTGQIVGVPAATSSVSLLDAGGVAFSGGQDFEGLTNDGAGGLLLSGEASNSLYRYSVGGGMAIEITQPAAFANARGNLGLEAVTAGNGVVWTANEEALTTDGPTANSGTSTLVRLQQLSSGLAATSQFAYAVDAIPNTSFVAPQSQSGVSGLLLLPNNELLVLERRTEIDFINGLTFVNSIYRVDFAGADDTTSIAMLDNTVNTVAKELLWSDRFDDDNFEGLAFGPQLDNGETSLLLISDSGGGQNQSLFALAAADIGAVAVPSPGALVLLLSGLFGMRRNTRKQPI